MAKNLTLVACVDDRMGMMFNSRRQSKDRVMRERLLTRLAGKRLWMSEYSARLYGEGEGVFAHASYARKAKSGEAMLAEDSVPSLRGVDTVILYRWNEHYPADTYFPYDLSREGFTSVACEDFVGSSHEKITEEIFKRL